MKRYALVALLVLLARPAEAQQLFSPEYGSGVSVNCSTTAASALLPVPEHGGASVVVTNAGSSGVYFKIGPSDVEAEVNADEFLLPESKDIYYRDRKGTHISCITASGTTTLKAMPGYGG